MSAVLKIRSARSEDLRTAAEILVECGLPTAGVTEHLEYGYAVAEHGAEIVGVCGIEVYDQYGLLRSLAVSRPWRRRSVGRALVADRVVWAKAKGIAALYLLTIDACGYFDGLGFTRVGRDEVPQEIRESSEFRSLCPETAIAMVRWLGDQGNERLGPPGSYRGP